MMEKDTKAKWQKLEELFNQSDKIHAEMRELFLKNGITTPDLKLLSESDQEKWRELNNTSNALGTQMCEIIDSK